MGEIQARLQLAEAHVEETGRRYRALPAYHPARAGLLHQFEFSAAVRSELQDFEGLISDRKEPARRSRTRE